MSGPQRQPADKTARRSKVERYNELLVHARRLLTLQGYRATTLAQIAEAASVPESELLRHFPTRVAVLAALLAPARVTTVERWQTAQTAGVDPLSRLHQAIELYLQTLDQYASELTLLQHAVAEGSDPEVAERARGLYLQCETFLSGLITEGQQTGVFRRSLDPRVGAAGLIRAGLGHLLIRPFVLARTDPGYPARAVECLLHGLLKTDV
jgi:AcrR family transcriptional regulator